MSRAHSADGPDPVTPHQLVRDLETSIAARLAASNETREEVVRAQQRAAQLITEAESAAAVAAQQRAAGIVSAAREEASRLTEVGRRAAADLSAAAAQRRDADVDAIVAAVLPNPSSHGNETS